MTRHDTVWWWAVGCFPIPDILDIFNVPPGIDFPAHLIGERAEDCPASPKIQHDPSVFCRHLLLYVIGV